MKWWIRSQHPVWAIGIALIGTVAVIASPDSFGLPIPSLAGPTGFASIRSYALVAVLITVGAWASVSAGHKFAVLAATRAMQLYVLASLFAVVGACGLLAGVWGIFTGGVSGPAQLLLRDVLGLFGLGMILVPRTGYRFAGIVSTVYVFISAIFGRTSDGDSALWAWPISDSSDVKFWIPAVVLFVVGGVMWVLRSRGAYSRVLIAQAMDARRE
jgi:hypothetical protein